MNPIQKLFEWDQARKDRWADFFFDTLGIPIPLFALGIVAFLYYTRRHAISALVADWRRGRKPRRPGQALTAWEALDEHVQADTKTALYGIVVGIAIAVSSFMAAQ